MATNSVTDEMIPSELSFRDYEWITVTSRGLNWSLISSGLHSLFECLSAGMENGFAMKESLDQQTSPVTTSDKSDK